MTKAKTIGIAAAVLLCLGLARPDRAAAAEATAGCQATATSPAAPATEETQANVSDLAGLFADLSAGMSHAPQAAPGGAGGPSMACDLVCCFEMPWPFDVTVCCVLGSCRVV